MCQRQHWHHTDLRQGAVKEQRMTHSSACCRCFHHASSLTQPELEVIAGPPPSAAPHQPLHSGPHLDDPCAQQHQHVARHREEQGAAGLGGQPHEALAVQRVLIVLEVLLQGEG
jgi:hypothetical protein